MLRSIKIGKSVARSVKKPGGAKVPAHLAATGHEVAITEFEQALICAAEAFYRFAGHLLGGPARTHNLSGQDNVILQQLVTANRPQRISDLSRFANRDDTSNIQYSLRKLIRIGFVEKISGSTNRDTAYNVTDEARLATEKVINLRRKLLIEPTSKIEEINKQLQSVSIMLGLLTGVYDHGSRMLIGSQQEEK